MLHVLSSKAILQLNYTLKNKTVNILQELVKLLKKNSLFFFITAYYQLKVRYYLHTGNVSVEGISRLQETYFISLYIFCDFHLWDHLFFAYH